MIRGGRTNPLQTEVKPARAPDLIEPLLGYRYWRIAADGSLRCLISNERWAPGANRAHCWRRGHEAPGRLCTCGFNALHDLPGANRRMTHRNTVLGAIAAWGDTEVHRTGFRAQFACVVALAEGGVTRPASHRRLLMAAKRYGLELVPIPDLAAAAGLHARPLEVSARHGRPARPHRAGPT